MIDGPRVHGADVVAYDPVATENIQERFPAIACADSAATALADADSVISVTDWDEVVTLDEEFNAMAAPIVVDGPGIVEPTDEVVYEGVTW